MRNVNLLKDWRRRTVSHLPCIWIYLEPYKVSYFVAGIPILTRIIPRTPLDWKSPHTICSMDFLVVQIPAFHLWLTIYYQTDKPNINIPISHLPPSLFSFLGIFNPMEFHIKTHLPRRINSFILSRRLCF